MASYVKSLKDNRGNLIIPRTTAKVTTFDNSSSGLSSTNTQAAIDEMMAKGWISSDDSVPSDPVKINADSLGGIPAVNYATNDGVDAKISQINPDTINAANKDLSNLSDYQKALYNIGGRPNRNLLDNWYFAGGGSQNGYGVFPINQKGQTSYSELQKTMFDRWWHTNDPGTFELTDEGLKITAEAGTNACMAQFFDGIVSEDTEVTLSALYRGQIILDYYGYTHTPSPVVNDGWGMHAYTYTIPAGTNLADKIYCPTVKAVAGTTAYILAVKFENGDKQTIAYKDSNGIWRLFETQDYGKTLAACQRQLLMGPLLGVPVMTLSGGYGFFVATPRTMRTNPAVIGAPKIYKFPGIDDTGNEVTVSSFNTVLENNGVYVFAAGEFDGTTLCRLSFPAGTGLSAEL